MNGHYGEAPVEIAPIDLSADWHEFMHYLYLPVRIPASDDPDNRFRAPELQAAQMDVPYRLDFLRRALSLAAADAYEHTEHLRDPYIYVTARRGFATPGNPLNRPGWHCDDFGGTDLNYIWSDRWPTRFLRSDEPLDIRPDDATSMEDMATAAEVAENPDTLTMRIGEGLENTLLRLSPYVIHNTPEIPRPGGMRSFFKISVSTHRYNLLGNSHNHLLDYDWPMYDREAVRNQPQGNGDYVTEAVMDRG